MDVWVSLMKKKYGAVATGSPAFSRLVNHLGTFGGLQSILGACSSGVVLHDANGIPECNLLDAELQKCKAGGLPPPAAIPTTEDRVRTQEAAAQKRTELQAQERKDVDDKAKQGVGLWTEEADLQLYANNSVAHGVSAGAIQALAPQDALHMDMQKVHFAKTVVELASLSGDVLDKAPRHFVFVDAVVSGTQTINAFIDAADVIWKRYAAGQGAGDRGQTRFRVVINLGDRVDMFAKAVEKAAKVGFQVFCMLVFGHIAQLRFDKFPGVWLVFAIPPPPPTRLAASVLSDPRVWPSWQIMSAQLRRKPTQSRRRRPSFAVLAAPDVEISASEPTVIDLPNGKGIRQGLFLRCTEVDCPLRPEDVRSTIASQLALGQVPDQLMEIQEEDRNVDILSMMESDMCDGDGDDLGQADSSASGAEAAKSRSHLFNASRDITDSCCSQRLVLFIGVL